MTMKPFEIQGTTLSIGGVDLSTSSTGSLVIPGITRATGYVIDEIEDTGDQTDSWNEVPTVVDGMTWSHMVAGTWNQSTAVFSYQVELDDDGYIDEIGFSGSGPLDSTWVAYMEQGRFRATTVANPFASINLNDWVEIPFVAKMTAGGVESEFGGGGSSALEGLDDVRLDGPSNGEALVWDSNDEVWKNQTISGGSGDTGDVTFSNNVVEGYNGGEGLGLSPGPTFTNGSVSSGEGDPDLGPQYFQVTGGDTWEHLHFKTTDSSKFDLYIGDDNKYFKLSKNGPAVVGTEDPNEPYDNHTWTFNTDGSLTFPDGSIQTSAGGLAPELVKSNGNLLANATIELGESVGGRLFIVDSDGGDDVSQYFHTVVGDADGGLFAGGSNNNGPEYIWAFNSDGTVRWKVGIDDFNGYNVKPRTMATSGNNLVVGVTFDNTDDDSQIGTITLAQSDGTFVSSANYTTNVVGWREITDLAIDDEDGHILVGQSYGENVLYNNTAPIEESWGSNINVLTVPNSTFENPLLPWDYDIQIQNNPQDVNSWYSPDSVNSFRNLPVNTVTGTGGPQTYVENTDFAAGQLSLVIGDGGTTANLRLDASWINNAGQTHLLAQTGAYSFTIVCFPGTYVTGQVTSWSDVGGGIYETGLSVTGTIADGSYDVTSLTIEKSTMTVELNYVPEGQSNGVSEREIYYSGVYAQGQGYAGGDVVKVLGSQMGGIDTITLSGEAMINSTSLSLYFSGVTYPEMSQVQNGWRASGPGIDGWVTLNNVQDAGGQWRFDLPPGSTITAGEMYTIDNDGNDITLTLADWGGGPYINAATGRVSAEVAATTRFNMSQGIDYRGYEITPDYAVTTDFADGVYKIYGTGTTSYFALADDATDPLSTKVQLGNSDAIHLEEPSIGSADVTIVGSYGAIAGTSYYGWQLSDNIAGTAGVVDSNITLARFGNGTIVDTWNLRRSLDSQSFIITPSWQHTYGGTGYQVFKSVAYDSSDNSVYAHGEFNNNSNELAVFKFDYATGDITWVKYVEDTEGSGDDASSIVVDGAGNVYVCGRNDDGDTIVTKLTSTGDLVWQVLQENSDNWDNDPTMGLDSNGDIIVGGEYYYNDEDYDMWSIMKLSKVDGSLIWARKLGNTQGFNMNSLNNYETDLISVVGDNAYLAGQVYDAEDDDYVAVAGRFNTSSTAMGSFDRWIYSNDTLASWITNTSNAVVVDASESEAIVESDQTEFTKNNDNISVTADAVGDVNTFTYAIGGSSKLLFADSSELTTAGIARHSVDNGDNSTTLTANMNGKFIYFNDNPNSWNSTLYIPSNANTELPIGFTVTVVMGNFNGSRVYVNNNGNNDVTILAAGSDNFGSGYWQFNANTNSAGVYTIMKIDTDTWMLAGPDVTTD